MTKISFNRTKRAIVVALTVLALFLAHASASLAGWKAKQFTLDNGLKVVVIQDKRSAIVTHQVWYKVGSADEPAGKSGIAHFLEHLLARSAKYGKYAKLFDTFGGYSNAFTNADYTYYVVRTHKSKLAQVMAMEASRMANLVISDKAVAIERKVVQAERRRTNDSKPAVQFYNQLLTSLYLNHPYGKPNIGWGHEIARLNRIDAQAMYDKFYGPNNATLVIVGNVELDEIRAMVEQAYGRLAPNKNITARVRAQEPVHLAQRFVMLKDARVNRGLVERMIMLPSYRTARPLETEALELLTVAIRQRLYRTLVIENKTAVSTTVWFTSTTYDRGRLVLAATPLKPGLAKRVGDDINFVLSDIRDFGITEKELKRVRSQLLAADIFAADSQDKIARRYGVALTNGLTVADVEAWPTRIGQVTLKQVQAVARAYLTGKATVAGMLLPDATARKKGPINVSAKRAE
jgi:zinc protease